MKKNLVIAVNVFITVAMLTFVVLYSSFEHRDTTQRQIEHFENTTVTMEHVTENYLEGEQRICDVWARYINSKEMTMEEAVSFISISHVLPNASAHIVFWIRCPACLREQRRTYPTIIPSPIRGWIF